MRTDVAFAPLGRTGLLVSPVSVGTAAWGVQSAVHGLAVPERDAVDTVLRAFASERVNVLDTSNNYGDGESERRVGVAISEFGGVPDGFLVQTKLDRDPVTGSFSPDRMRTSLEQSLDRLGLDRIPLLFLHDPENTTFEKVMAEDGPVATLVALRDEGYVDSIGVAGGPASMLLRFVETGLFTALITHNRYTLVDRTADALLTAAYEAGVGVFNGAVYGGGILANWPRTHDRYHYAPASVELLSAVDAMGAVCEQFGVPLIAAALQFSTRDPRITSTIAGMVSPRQFDETIALLDLELPDELWHALDAVTPHATGWIND
jgi:D-threo-aldose 1-dehydrogenase